MQVTFADKDDTQPLSDPRKIFSDDDCNEMKDAINRNATEKANTSGTNTYTATFTPTITSLTDGLKIHVKIKTASSGPSTLQADATAAKKIFINPTTQADSGDLVDEQEYYMSYDSALDAATGGWLIIGAGGGGGSGTVESVTGDGVDNTDPDNPVLTFPIASEVVFTPAGNLAATDVQAALAEVDVEKLDALVITRTETATHDLDATDLANVNLGKHLVILCNFSPSGALEIPTNANQAFPIGTVIGWVQYGTGQVTITPLSGVTMRSANNADKSYAQYSQGYIEKIGTNEWVLSGDITV